ncbi:Retrovirus-related Pol polyprotein from transposon 17.6-like protein [Drosera capensis]
MRKFRIVNDEICATIVMKPTPRAEIRGNISEEEELWSWAKAQHPHLAQIFGQYQQVFMKPTGIPPDRAPSHRINLKQESSPISVRPYRGLNLATIKDKFPISVIDELLGELHGAKYFSKLDLQAGYHQILVHPTDVEKTAFRTHNGHYEFLIMPFGLSNTPSTFPALMNDIFRPYLQGFILICFYDILIYNSTWETYLQHLQFVFFILANQQHYVKKEKCCFGTIEIRYLRHIIREGEVRMEPSKITAIEDWPKPTLVTALRGFLGLTGYYRKFIKDYGKIAAP